MIRDILDYQGQVIGQLELPDDTTEEQWAIALAPYAAPPPSPQEQVQQQLEITVQTGKEMAQRVIEKFKQSNLLAFIVQDLTQDQMIAKSLWVHHRLRAVSVSLGGVDYVIDLLNLCISGDIETAAVVVQLMQPDDMSQPYHFLSQEVIDTLLGLICDEIGG